MMIYDDLWWFMMIYDDLFIYLWFIRKISKFLRISRKIIMIIKYLIIKIKTRREILENQLIKREGMDLMQIWRLLISINWILSIKEMNPITTRVCQNWPPYICLLFSCFSNVYHSACVWPTALKLRCVANLDTLFLFTFISLVDEIQFMLISGRHICIRSIVIDTHVLLTYSLLHLTFKVHIIHFSFKCDVVASDA